jgi:hypothetical protein
MLPGDDIKDAKKRPMPFYNKVVPGAHFYYDFLSPIDELEAFYTLLLANGDFERRFFHSACVHCKKN